MLAIFWLINNLENLILYRLGRAMGGGGGYGLSSNPGDKTYIPLLFRRISSGRIMDFAFRHLGLPQGHLPDIWRIVFSAGLNGIRIAGFAGWQGHSGDTALGSQGAP